MTNFLSEIKPESDKMEYLLDDKYNFIEILKAINFSDNIVTINTDELKNATKYIVNSLDSEKLSQENFDILIKNILSYYLQNKFKEKCFNKNSRLYSTFFHNSFEENPA